MTADINRRLYSPCNVIRKLTPDYSEWSQEYILAEKGWPGAVRIPREFYGYERFGAQKFRNKTLVVPGTTQTNTITISEDTGGHIVKWLYSSNEVAERSIVNLYGGQGRGISSVLVIFEDLPAISIASIETGAETTTITLAQDHPWEPNKQVSCTISGITVGGGGEAGINAGHRATSSIDGTNYRRKFTIALDTSAGTYAGGQVVFHPVHNPTQGGSAVGTAPESAAATDDAYSTSDGVFNQGSPLIAKPVMRLIGTNQGYIKTVCVPMEFNPDGQATGNEHGGSHERPVLWHGFILQTEMWINFEGHEGVHKVVSTVTNRYPVNCGSFGRMSINLDPHFNYNLGLEAGEPLFKIVHFDTGELAVFGDDYLNNIDTPGLDPGETLVDADAATRAVFEVRGQGHSAFRSDADATTELTGADNPFNEVVGGPYGGWYGVIDSDEAFAIGLWNVYGSNFDSKAFSIANNIVDDGFTDDSNGTSVLGSSHHQLADLDNNILSPGTRSITNWIVGGDVATVLDAPLTLFNTMLEEGYY